MVRLDLFHGYIKLVDNSYRDIFVNIASFIPIGLLVGLISNKFGLLKALLVGLVFSLTIEFLQLVWKRGTFDVDDIWNNAVGTVIGGLIAVVVVRMRGGKN